MMSAMDEMLDEEISFLEQSCEQLRLEIEKQSTPVVRNRSMRDSGIATIPKEVVVRECLPEGVANDTVVSVNLRQTENSQADSSYIDGVTLRKTAQRKPASAQNAHYESAQQYSADAPVAVTDRLSNAPNAHLQTASAPQENRMHAQHHLPLQVHSQIPVPAQAQQQLATGELSTVTDSVGQRRNNDFARRSFNSRPPTQMPITTDRNATKCNIKPATFDGSHSWIDYKSHFDACAAINNWSDREKGLYLAVSLRGAAQGVLGNVSSETGQQYNLLVEALEERFAPPNQTELYRAQLKERRQRASETLTELGQAIRRLTCLAYPSVLMEVRETLGKEAFIDALVDSTMRLRLKQSRPQNLNEAIRLAVELDAYYKTEKRSHVHSVNFTKPTSENESQSKDLFEMMQTLQDKIESLEKRIEEKGKNQGVLEGHRFANTQRSGKVKCYKCPEEGHIRRNCPKLKRERDSSTRRSEQPKEGNARRIRGKQRRKNRKSSKGNVGASNLCEEAGIFIDSEVNGLKTKLLIDTGASLTLLSKRIYDKIPDKPVLEESRQVITSASGSRLCQYGKADFVIEIGRSRETVKLMVVDISVDGILGLDFLRACKGDINFERSSLKLNNEECRFSWEGTLGCDRVTVDKDVCLPPRSEVVIQAKVPGENTFGSADYLVEAEPKFLESGRALVGRTLVKGHNIVPVCLMNITESVQQIHGGTLIAKMTAVEEQNASAGEAENSAKGLRSDLRELFDRCKLNLSPAQFSKVELFLHKNEDLFATSNYDLGRTHVVKHKINTELGTRPIKQAPRRIPLHLSQEVDKQVNEMVDKGVIETSISPWASPVVLVHKKDGTMRFCVDYRRLNEVTVKDAYPLPKIEEAFDHLSGHAMFSTLDLSSGYWQVGMEKGDKEKTAFVTRKGLYLFRVMPFGLCCAPGTFERLMETVLAGLQWDKCLVYLDDIIVVGKSFEDMLENLGEVFKRLRQAGL